MKNNDEQIDLENIVTITMKACLYIIVEYVEKTQITYYKDLK